MILISSIYVVYMLLTDVSSDLNKIPSTLSAAQMRARELGNVPKSQSQSVFYLDPNRAEAGELQGKHVYYSSTC